MRLSRKYYATVICSIAMFCARAGAQTNPYIAWGVTGGNEVWHLSASGWAYVPPPPGSTPKTVSSSADGTVWMVDSNGSIFSYTGSGWNLIPGNLRQISVGNAKNVWGVTSASAIYRWNGSGFAQVAGPASAAPKQVSVGNDGTVWCLDTVGNIYSYTGSGWQNMPGNLVQMSVGSASNVWGVNSASGIYQWNGSSWAFIPPPPNTTAKWVGVGADGNVYVLDVLCNVWTRDGSGWKFLNGILVQISAAISDHFSYGDASVVKQGGWTAQINASAASGGYVQSATTGDTLTYKFTGDSVALYRLMDKNGGYASVTVDGKDQGYVQFYFPESRWQVPAVIDNLGAGQHTLVLKVTGSKSSASSGKNIYVDSFSAPAPFVPSAIQVKALNLLNSYRATVGYPPARLSATLSMAAQSHADYMAARGFAGLNHNETAGTADFTGTSSSARGQYFGYSVFTGTGETIDNDATAEGCLDYWTSVIYHREPVFNYFYSEVGFGSNSANSVGMCAMNYASRGSAYPASRMINSYPANNQTNVPINYAVDAPDPHLADPSTLGPVISVYITPSATDDGDTDTAPTTATLTDPNGNSIPVFVVTNANDPNKFVSTGEYVLIPKQVLKPNAQYTAHVAGIDPSGNPYDTSWSFGTIPNSSITIINGTWLSTSDTSFQFSTAGPAVSTQVVYGLTTAYGLNGDTAAEPTANLFTAHLRGLTSGTTYHCQVIATDAQGKVSRSADKVIKLP